MSDQWRWPEAVARWEWEAVTGLNQWRPRAQPRPASGLCDIPNLDNGVIPAHTRAPGPRGHQEDLGQAVSVPRQRGRGRERRGGAEQTSGEEEDNRPGPATRNRSVRVKYRLISNKDGDVHHDDNDGVTLDWSVPSPERGEQLRPQRLGRPLQVRVQYFD